MIINYYYNYNDYHHHRITSIMSISNISIILCHEGAKPPVHITDYYYYFIINFCHISLLIFVILNRYAASEGFLCVSVFCVSSVCVSHVCSSVLLHTRVLLEFED